MPIFDVGPLVYRLRERKGMEQDALLMINDCGFDDSTLRRIESGKQNPKYTTLKAIIKRIGLPLKGFVYFMTDDKDMEIYSLCDRMSQALERGDITEAEEVMAKIENHSGFYNGIQLQFKLSKKAQLMEMMGEPADQILPLIEEALKITFEGVENDDREKIFILEEPDLLHTKARIHAKNGKLDDALRILLQMKSSLEILPEADREKERQYAPVLLSLSKCLLRIKDFKGAYENSETGAAYSAARRQGWLNPDFEYIKALALRGLDQNGKCLKPLLYAYFGFILLGETVRARDVRNIAKDEFGVTINTYGVDKLDFTQHFRIPYSRAEPVKCKSIGSMIGALRYKAGIPRDVLCRGICHGSTLMRIEMDLLQGQIYTLEAVMQRLGLDIHLYGSFFLSREEFVVTQLRDRIEVLIAERHFAEAEKMLSELETMKRPLLHGVNRQFVKMIRAILFAAGGNAKNPEYPKMLLDALRITCPMFDERDIEEYRLTFNELALIAQYAAYFNGIDDPHRAVEIYGRLYRNIGSKYADEVVKARMYSAILSNYSTCLGIAGRLYEALAIITEGENFELSRGRLTVLPLLAFNRGYNMYLLGLEKESIPYIALAYYGASLLAEHGKADYLPLISEYAREKLKLVFD